MERATSSLRLRALVMVGLVLGMIVIQTAAIDDETVETIECYAGCLPNCIRKNPWLVALCSALCVKQCSFSSYGLKPDALVHNKNALKNDTQLFYCKLGCSTALCTDLSTPRNPNAEKVGRCMGSCSETCTKYSSP